MGNQPCGGALRGGVQTRITADGIKTDRRVATDGLHVGQKLALCVMFQFPGHLLRIVLRQCTHFKVKRTLGGHDIQRPAALNQTRLYRGKRRIKTRILAFRRGNEAEREVAAAEKLLPADYWYERRRARTVRALIAQSRGEIEAAAQALDAGIAALRADRPLRNLIPR